MSRAIKRWGSRWLALFCVCLATPGSAQNHPELEWRVLQTEHFRVLYHDGLETTAQQAASIAEAAWQPVTELYDYRPSGPVRLILKDYDDYANGAAYFYHDAIEIWTSPLEHDYELRGTSDWLRNVITHEFVHIISLGAARKGSQRVPAWFVEYFGYKEETNRDDILTGAPDRLTVAPLANTVIPMWFAEGVAQFQTSQVRHDRWDSHRDMILRTAVLADNVLPLEQMGVFGKRGLGNEFVYDHGYGFVRYIAATYGDSALPAICRQVGQWRTTDVNGALEAVTGRPAQALWQDWRDSMGRRYAEQVQSLGDLREGAQVTDTGFSNTRPVFAPDGNRVAYLSTGKRHFGPPSLLIRDLQSGEDEAVAPAVASVPAWDPDGEHLLFVRKKAADKYGSRRADLLDHDLKGQQRGWVSNVLWTLPALIGVRLPEDPRTVQLTRNLRALYPAVSPDGERIAFVMGGTDGATLALADRDGNNVVELLRFKDRTQLYTPRWSPDGHRLAISWALEGRRNIGLVEIENPDGFIAGTNVIEPLITSDGTDRDPVWTADGEELLFVSDVSGIFNIYALHMRSGSVEQVTNVMGGAFFPTVNAAGDVIYSGYGADGFHLHKISRDVGVAAASKMFSTDNHLLDPPFPLAGSLYSPLARLVSTEEQPYGMEMLRTTVMPRLSFDEGHTKLGAYFGTSEALDKQSIFGAANYTPTNGDRDLYAVYRFRGFRPTWRLSFIHLKRHSARGDSSEARDFFVKGMNFSLNRLTLGVSGHLNSTSTLDASLAYDRYDASLENDQLATRRDGQPGFERIEGKPIGYTYLNGFDLALVYRHDSVARRQDRDINPRSGRRLYARYDRMSNWFIEGFNEQNTSFLQEEYLGLFYNQFTGEWREFVGLPKNTTLALRAYGGLIDSDRVDTEEVGDFFDFHLGGIPYMRGYTFYSIEGRKAAMANATFRFPILPSVQRRLGPLFIDRLYGAVYGDIGKAWDENFSDPDPVFGRKGPVRDAGVQLRFDLISFYSLPTRIQLDAAYGFDEVDNKGPWKLYLTVLFNYINSIDPGE
jgi:Tol biopolymer transport system component